MLTQRLFALAIVGMPLLIAGSCSLEEGASNGPIDVSPQIVDKTTGGDADDISEEVARLMQEIREAIPHFENDAELQWLAENFGNTAVNIANEHGTQGVEVILALRQQGVAVMREHPDTFNKVAKQLGGETAASFLVFLHQHFKEIAKAGGLPQLLVRIESLPPEMKAVGRKHPEMLLFMACGREATYEALREHPRMCLICFPLIDLSKGPEPLERVARMITQHGQRAGKWVESRGLDGLLLADTFSSVLDWDVSIDLPVFLEILSNNQQDIEELIANGHEVDLLRTFSQLADEDRRLRRPGGDGFDDFSTPRKGDWLQLACVDPRTIRLLVDKGNVAYDILRRTWGETASTGITLPSLLYDAYMAEDLPGLHRHAWQALLIADWEPDTFQMLCLMAEYPGQDPRTIHCRSRRFRQLLAKHDARVVAYLAEAELSAGATENRYQLLEDRGEQHLDTWESPPSFVVETLPLYDVVQLGCLLAQGQVPTRGEVAFAGIDVLFTAWDIATLGAGTVASTSAKTGMKVAGKEGVEQASKKMAKSLVTKAGKEWGDEAAESVGQTLAGRMSRSPKGGTAVADNKTFQNIAVNRSKAVGSANRKQIPITSRIVNFTATEWAINVTVGGSLVLAADWASKRDNSVWSIKVQEALLAIDSFANAPIINNQ